MSITLLINFDSHAQRTKILHFQLRLQTDSQNLLIWWFRNWFLDLCENCPRSGSDLTTICEIWDLFFGVFKTDTKISPRYVPDLSQICPGSVQYLSSSTNMSLKFRNRFLELSEFLSVKTVLDFLKKITFGSFFFEALIKYF